MKTYTVIFAQDVPHYGSVEIEAKNDEAAIRRAKAYWRSIESGKKRRSQNRSSAAPSSLALSR
jgi:hypothetical protein